MVRIVDRCPCAKRHRKWGCSQSVLRHALMHYLAMNVIRMIKLFGWEPRVAAQLSEKRAEELKLVKTNKVLNLVNSLIKYVCFL